MLNEKVIEEIDSFTIILENNDFIRTKGNLLFHPHIHVKYGYGGNMHITMSSKISAQENSLEGVNTNNIHLYTEALKLFKNINISAEMLLNSQLTRVDKKVDVYNNSGLTENEVISILRELAYQCTSKFDLIVGHDKDKRRETSLILKPMAKTVNDSLAIYVKIPEIIAHKREDLTYFNKFSDEFFEKNIHLIRFERRLQRTKSIRKAFHMEKNQKATLSDILNSNINVVAEKVQEFFL